MTVNNSSTNPKNTLKIDFKFIDFWVDREQNLLKLMIFGSVLTYVAVIFNIIVFVILLRKKILSPATILMQGLAMADGLTAFCSYGLEPLFQSQYHCKHVNEWYDCAIPFPYCKVYVHLSILSMNFPANDLFRNTESYCYTVSYLD